MLSNVDLFLLAAWNGDILGVQNYIDQGGDINVKHKDGGDSAIIYACSRGYLDLLIYLVEHGANLNVTDKNGLNTMMVAGNLDIVTYLVENMGMDVNAKAKNGWTSVMNSCYEGHLGITQYLVNKGADVNDNVNTAMTALMAACKGGHLEIVEYLVNERVDVNAKAKDGLTALFYACEVGTLDVVHYLISQGSDITAKDNIGVTPLMHASHKGYIDIVKLLVKEGADIDAKAMNDKDAEWLANHSSHVQIVKYLKAKRIEKMESIVHIIPSRIIPYDDNSRPMERSIYHNIDRPVDSQMRGISNTTNDSSSVKMIYSRQIEVIGTVPQSNDESNIIKYEKMEEEINNHSISSPPLYKRKHLSEFNVSDVSYLLVSLNLTKYRAAFEEHDIDGRTLMNCRTEEDVIELGISLTAKARILFEEINKLKETTNEVETLDADNLPVPAYIYCDDRKTVNSDLTRFDDNDLLSV